MRQYSDKIALIKNSRGIYCLDTSIGCYSGMNSFTGGCYGDCYAAKSAKTYGYNFSKTVLRNFNDRKHRSRIIAQINNSKLDFIRIGCSGDPSENWDHCIKIINEIKNVNKQIVIITKHWNKLQDKHLQFLSGLNICFNTSVSALDNSLQLQSNLTEYNRIKRYCKSILRIVSCDFNKENIEGLRLSFLQDILFKNEDVIDTIFRPSKNNKLVTDGVINVKTGVFNGNRQTMSKFNKKTYAGKCGSCLEMCGVKIKNELHTYKSINPIVKQKTLF